MLWTLHPNCDLSTFSSMFHIWSSCFCFIFMRFIHFCGQGSERIKIESWIILFFIFKNKAIRLALQLSPLFLLHFSYHNPFRNDWLCYCLVCTQENQEIFQKKFDQYIVYQFQSSKDNAIAVNNHFKHNDYFRSASVNCFVKISGL